MNKVVASLSYVVFALILAVSPIVLALLLVLTFPFDRNRVVVGRSLRFIARLVSMSYPRWRMELRDVPRLDTSKRWVVVANHESMLDVFLISRVPWEMKWMAKASLFKVPWLGLLFRLAGDIPVDRGDRGSGAGALKRARDYVERGMPVMIFPEGTRSRDGQLLEFKPGAFRIALETGAEILPIAVHGSAAGMPVGSPWIRPAHAVAQVLEPISTRGMTLEDLDALTRRVRDQLSAVRDALAREAASRPGRTPTDIGPSGVAASADPLPNGGRSGAEVGP